MRTRGEVIGLSLALHAFVLWPGIRNGAGTGTGSPPSLVPLEIGWEDGMGADVAPTENRTVRPRPRSRSHPSSASRAPRAGNSPPSPGGTSTTSGFGARKSAAPGGSDYLELVRAHVERYKIFPESSQRRGESGRVAVSFAILADGRLVDIRVKTPSPFPGLDDAAVETVRRASPAPANPRGSDPARIEVWLPIDFALAE